MEKFNTKIIICGFALLLFGIIIASGGEMPLAYIFGGLGLFLVVLGSFGKGNG